VRNRFPSPWEEVKARDWVAKVYEPDIQNKWDTVYKKPGYDPSEL
jgi:4-oxalocrotonate tautomerase